MLKNVAYVCLVLSIVFLASVVKSDVCRPSGAAVSMQLIY